MKTIGMEFFFLEKLEKVRLLFIVFYFGACSFNIFNTTNLNLIPLYWHPI